jgi:VanZ family protein
MLKKNIFSIIVALVILYLSLADAQTFDTVPVFNIPFIDKIVHLGMYFGLMSALIFDNRKSIKTNRQLFLVGLIPFFYGILIEILQSSFTVTRNGDLWDAFADLLGILVSIFLWFVIKPLFTKSLR